MINSTEEFSPAFLILSSAEELYSQLTISQRDEVIAMLQDCTNTQRQVADWLHGYLGMPDNRFASVYRVVQMIVSEDLTAEKTHERFLHAQRSNALKAQAAEFDRSEAGKQGGAIRMRQMKESGVTPSGHPI